ncbi:MAG: antibiotic biosynthesis monooxygenase [Pseudomonadota bacterium]
MTTEMLRVVYEWQVAEENFDEFRTLWSETTDRIHDSTNGAQGSTLLRSADDPTRVLAIAKWTSEEAWRTFWADSNPSAMHGMRRLGERMTVNAYHEIEDRTH